MLKFTTYPTPPSMNGGRHLRLLHCCHVHTFPLLGQIIQIFFVATKKMFEKEEDFTSVIHAPREIFIGERLSFFIEIIQSCWSNGTLTGRNSGRIFCICFFLYLKKFVNFLIRRNSCVILTTQLFCLQFNYESVNGL